MASASKTVSEVKNYVIDYSAAVSNGETLSTSAWAAYDDSAITINSPAADMPTTTSARVWIASGTLGKTATITNTVTTTTGRILQRSFTIQVVDKNLLS